MEIFNDNILNKGFSIMNTDNTFFRGNNYSSMLDCIITSQPNKIDPVGFGQILNQSDDQLKQTYWIRGACRSAALLWAPLFT